MTQWGLIPKTKPASFRIALPWGPLLDTHQELEDKYCLALLLHIQVAPWEQHWQRTTCYYPYYLLKLLFSLLKSCYYLEIQHNICNTGQDLLWPPCHKDSFFLEKTYLACSHCREPIPSERMGNVQLLTAACD